MYGNRTPRLPPIADDPKFSVVEERLRRQEETIQALLGNFENNKTSVG